MTKVAQQQRPILYRSLPISHGISAAACLDCLDCLLLSCVLEHGRLNLIEDFETLGPSDLREQNQPNPFESESSCILIVDARSVTPEKEEVRRCKADDHVEGGRKWID